MNLPGDGRRGQWQSSAPAKDRGQKSIAIKTCGRETGRKLQRKRPQLLQHTTLLPRRRKEDDAHVQSTLTGANRAKTNAVFPHKEARQGEWLGSASGGWTAPRDAEG
jgi:hypothetical protein